MPLSFFCRRRALAPARSMTIFWPPISTASQLACGGRRLKTRWGRLAIPKTALHRDHSNHGSARTVSKRTSILPGDNLSCRRSGLCGSMPTGSRLANITLSRGELRLTFQDQEIVGWAERSEAHHSPPQRHIRRRQRVRRGRDGSITCNQAHALKSRVSSPGAKRPIINLGPAPADPGNLTRIRRGRLGRGGETH